MGKLGSCLDYFSTKGGIHKVCTLQCQIIGGGLNKRGGGPTDNLDINKRGGGSKEKGG